MVTTYALFISDNALYIKYLLKSSDDFKSGVLMMQNTSPTLPTVKTSSCFNKYFGVRK